MIRKSIIAALLAFCLAFSLVSWFCWAKTDDLELVGKRFVHGEDQTTLYITKEGHLVLSRNAGFMSHVSDIQRKTASQPAVASIPRISQYVRPLQKFKFVGFTLTTYSSPIPQLPRGYEIVIPCWWVSILLALYPALAFVRGPYRRHRRRKKGLCLKCGYDLTGNVSGVCTECGEKIAAPLGPQDFERLLRNRRRRIPLRWGGVVLSLLMLADWILEAATRSDFQLPLLFPLAVVVVGTVFLWWYDLTPIKPPLRPHASE